MEHVPAKLQEQLFAHLFRLLATLLQALIAVHESPARILAERERQSNGIPEQDRAGFETYKQILLPPDGQEHPGLASQGRNASDRIRSPDHSPTRSRSRSRECERHNKPSDDSDSHLVYCIIYQSFVFSDKSRFFLTFFVCSQHPVKLLPFVLSPTASRWYTCWSRFTVLRISMNLSSETSLKLTWLVKKASLLELQMRNDSSVTARRNVKTCTVLRSVLLYVVLVPCLRRIQIILWCQPWSNRHFFWRKAIQFL